MIEPAVQELMQKVLEQLQGRRPRRAGAIAIGRSAASRSSPPSSDVTAAQQDRDRLRNEAEAYANRVVPVARGKAAAIIQAGGGLSRCRRSLRRPVRPSASARSMTQYKKAPDVTRERMYLETMESVYGGSGQGHRRSERQGQGVVPYLPLGRCTRQVRRGSAQMRSGARSSCIVVRRRASDRRDGVDVHRAADRAGAGPALRRAGAGPRPGHRAGAAFQDSVRRERRLSRQSHSRSSRRRSRKCSPPTIRRLEVDSFLRYRIVDPLKFYQTVGPPTARTASSASSSIRRCGGFSAMRRMTQIVRDNRAEL